MTSLDHIDPKHSQLVCGFEINSNEVRTSTSYNARKTNRFVPYRVCTYQAPVVFGDLGEFLIGDQWVVCEFGGEIWWDESNRLGNSCTAGGKTQGRRSVETQTGMFSPEYLESSKYVEDRKSIGRRRREERTGIFDPSYTSSDKCKEDKSKAGKSGRREDKVEAGKVGGRVTADQISKPISITFLDGSRQTFQSSTEAGRSLNLNGLTLRRLAISGRVGVKKEYKGMRVEFL